MNQRFNSIFSFKSLASIILIAGFVYFIKSHFTSSQEILTNEQALNSYKSVGVPKLKRDPSSTNNKVNSTRKNGIQANLNHNNLQYFDGSNKKELSTNLNYNRYESNQNENNNTNKIGQNSNTQSQNINQERSTNESFDEINNEKTQNNIDKDQDSVAGRDSSQDEKISESDDNKISNPSSSNKDTGVEGGRTEFKIKGTIPPLIQTLSTTYVDAIIPKAYAAGLNIICTNPTLQIFDLVTMTALADNPISIDPINNATEFEFDPTALNLDLTKPTLYFLKTKGCNYTFERIVTSYTQDQTITQASTIISQLVKTQLKDKVVDVNADYVNTLIYNLEELISESDFFDDTYTKMESSSIGDQFKNIFEGAPPALLKDSLPDLNSINIPSTIIEKATHNFSIQTYPHWSTDYTIAYEWLLVDLNNSSTEVLQSTMATWNFVPSANHSNKFKIILRVGKDDSTGRVIKDNTDIPYHEFSWTYPDSQINTSFINAYPVVAPDFNLDASQPNPTKVLDINLAVNTGASFINCETFSKFKITTSSTAPLASEFDLECTDENLQNIIYSLTALDGQRSFYIWAIDINENISSSKTTNVVIDQTAPIISYQTLAPAYRADTNFTLNWSIDERHSLSTINHTIELLNVDGTTWSVLTSTKPSINGDLQDESFSYSFTLPDRLQSGAKFRITVSDSLGNSASSESSVFDLQKAVLETNPTTFDFGDVLNNSQSSSNIFTINNTGTGATKNCLAPVITGTNASEFEIITDNCNTSILAASSSCTYEVVAKPSTKGAKSASISWVCDNDTTSANVISNSINNAPVAGNDTSISTNEDTAINFTAPSGSDIDNDPLTYTIVSGPAHGTLTNCIASNNDLNCDYTPVANYNGSDSFSYKVSDGTTDSLNVTIVNITVSPINDAPTIASTQTLSTNEDTPITFDLNLGNDIDGDSLNYVIVATTASGNLSCTGGTSRSCTFTPDLNFNGVLTFTYRVNDSFLNSNTATATITVNAVNDAPVAADNYELTIRDNLSVSITLNAGSDVDTAQGNLVYKLTTSPSIGTLSNCITTSAYSFDLTCDYIAPVNTNADVIIKYIVNDQSLDSINETTLTLHVQDKTSTVPNLSASNFTEGASTNKNPMTLTALNCDDISKILIKENTTTPLATDLGWQNCSTVAGAITFDPSALNTQGFRTLRIFGIDVVGNISTYDSMDFIYDSLAPQMVFDNVPTLPWGISYNIKWKLTEATISAAKNHTISISYNNGSTWSDIGSVNVASNGPHSDKYYSYTYNVPSGSLYSQVIFKVTLTDDNGMIGTANSNTFRIVEDLGAPFIHNVTFKINGSITPPATTVKYVNVDFTAEDIDTVLTHFCLKGNDTSVPTGDADCWKPFDGPSPGLVLNQVMSVANFSYLLGFTPSNFKVSIWVKDLAGNISSNANVTAGKDFVIMNYTPDPAPSISSLFVTNSDSPSNPVEDADLTFNNGDIVYINWNASDDKAIPAGSVDISYTIDDINFIPIASATNINNDKNNCPVLDSASNPLDDNATGCFQWNFPLADGQYFKINIVASDDAYQDTSTTSVALNSIKFKILAGNVDPGTGASAKSAQLFPRSSSQAPYSIAVSTDGKIFFNDISRGLLYINPYTNVLEQLLPDTNVSTGDGGPVTNATATEIYKINMDFKDRLLVWDRYALRRIDTTVNPMTIETIIGYKDDGTRGTNRSDTVLDPKDFQLDAPGATHIFQPLPNGDIWFADRTGSVSANNNLIRIYKGSLANPRIESIRISGIGGSAPPSGAAALSGNNTVNAELENENIQAYQIAFNMETSTVTSLYARYYRGLNGCSYLMRELVNPDTHLATGQAVPVFDTTCVDSYDRTTNDGKIWAWSYHIGYPTRVAEYNTTTNSYEATKLGNGVHGTCPDGTLATNCMLRLQDFYVASDGTFFLLESNTIRVIDKDGKVQTLYGQSRSFGDGGLGQDARFGSIQYIDHGIGDNVIMVDSTERIIREIRPSQATNQVIRVGGNGTLARGSFSFATAATDQMLDTGSWSQSFSMATNPSTGDVYYACSWDSVCKLTRSTGLWSVFFGVNGGTHWNSNTVAAGTTFDAGGYAPSINGYFNGNILSGHYDWSSGDQNMTFRLTSTSTGDSTYVAGKMEKNGATGCPSGVGTNCNLGSSRQYWAAATWDATASKILFELDLDRGAKTFRYFSANSATTAFAYPEYFLSIVKVGTIIYGCSETNALKKWDTSTGIVTELVIPGTAKCHGTKILYKPATGAKPNRLVFPFNQNGLHGIAEYFL